LRPSKSQVDTITKGRSHNERKNVHLPAGPFFASVRVCDEIRLRVSASRPGTTAVGKHLRAKDTTFHVIAPRWWTAKQMGPYHQLQGESAGPADYSADYDSTNPMPTGEGEWILCQKAKLGSGTAAGMEQRLA